MKKQKLLQLLGRTTRLNDICKIADVLEVIAPAVCVKPGREELAKIIYDGVMGTTGVCVLPSDSEAIADKIIELLEGNNAL